MKRHLLTPDDVKNYRWHLQLDAPFQPPALPRGFDYEPAVERILEMIWSPRMTDLIGIDLDRFYAVTKTSVRQQKRDLLDVALTLGPALISRSLMSAMDDVLHAENTGRQPVGLRPPALRTLPYRLAAMDGIEVWCGSAAAVCSDIALVIADLDLSHLRVSNLSDASIRAHSVAGPRLRSDCRLLKSYFEADFLPGSIALTRGYFSASKYLAHAVPPRIDDGIWKHSIDELVRCYEGLWLLAERVKAKRVAVHLIPLGQLPALQEMAFECLIGQVGRFRRGKTHPPTICLVGHTAAIGIKIAEHFRFQRLPVRFRGDGGFLPA